MAIEAEHFWAHAVGIGADICVRCDRRASGCDSPAPPASLLVWRMRVRQVATPWSER